LLNRYFDRPPRALLGLCFSSADRRFARDLRELILAFQASAAPSKWPISRFFGQNGA
jgi:hypothetical protein